MKKISNLLFICLFTIICVCKSLANDAVITTSFRKVLENKAPLEIILVSRNISSGQYNPIELDEISLIFACLAAGDQSSKKVEIREKLSSKIDDFAYTEDTKNITGYLKSPIVKTTRKQLILEAFDEYCKNLIQHVSDKNAWKVFVFNEMFFSKIFPLTSVETEKIRELFFHFLDSDNTLLHVNFLYTGKSKIPIASRQRMISEFSGEHSLHPHYLPPKALFMYNAEKHYDSLHANKTIVEEYKEFLGKLDTTTIYNLLFNRSFLFYKNIKLANYNKATYYFEANSLLIDKLTSKVKPDAYIYNIGSGKDLKDSEKEYPNFKKLIVDNITSEICYDLTLGIRKNNEWKNLDIVSKLHIYVSNTTNQSKCNFFPENKTTACVDPNGITSFEGDDEHALSLVFKKHGGEKYIHTNLVKSFKYGNNNYKITTINNVHL